MYRFTFFLFFSLSHEKGAPPPEVGRRGETYVHVRTGSKGERGAREERGERGGDAATRLGGCGAAVRACV